MSENSAMRKPLPGWSRILIIFVIVLFGSSLFGIIYGASEFKRTFDQSENPTYIANVAQNIANFPQKLPEKYKFVFGADLDLMWTFNMKIVAIDYDKQKQQLLFILVNQKSEANEMLGEAYRIGVNTHGYSGRFTKSISQGSWTFGGTKMPYIIGKVKGSDGTNHVGLVACMSAPKKSKTLLLYALQPKEKEKFDINVCIDLLKEIDFGK